MSIKHWFQNLVADKVIENAYRRGKTDEYVAIQKANETRRNEIEVIELQMLMESGAVINITNEHDNPLVGFIVDIYYISKAKNPVPVIKDYITGKESVVLGKVFKFTPQRLQALMKLTPEERVALVYSNCFGKEVEMKNLTTPLEDILDYDTVMDLLNTNKFPNETFFERLKTLQNKNTDTSDDLSA